MKTKSSGFLGLGSFLGFVILGLCLPAAASAQAIAEYPQAVRLSYVQGDVRFSRGDERGPDLAKGWEQARANLPIQAGYSLSTGNGRAEVEFECGSTLYLAENSVLLFETLTVRGEVPLTQMQLATGTATISFRPAGRETLDLWTPTEYLHLFKAYVVRVDSYVDGAAFTPQGPGKGDTTRWYLKTGQRYDVKAGSERPAGLPASETAADWDGWVAARVKQREADTAAALKASGLTSFVPGLTDLYKEGTFFPCEPYGMCWEPKGQAEALESQNLAAPPVRARNRKARAGSLQLAALRIPSGQPSAQQSGAAVRRYYYPISGCPTWELGMIDPETAEETFVPGADGLGMESWLYAQCYSGAWIYRHKRYTFVAGKPWHHPPVHWIRTTHGFAYVPRHPNDVEGKTPLNLKYGAFEARNGMRGGFAHAEFRATEKYTVLQGPPKEIRELEHPQLASATRPEIQGRLIRGGNGGAGHITYDYKAGSFLQAGHSGKAVEVGKLSEHATYAGQVGHAGGGAVAGGIGRAGGGGSTGSSGRAAGGATGSSGAAPSAGATSHASSGRP
jgi:hypothetical protein